MKKLGKMFSFANPVRDVKKRQDMGCGGTDPLDVPSSNSARA